MVVEDTSVLSLDEEEPHIDCCPWTILPHGIDEWLPANLVFHIGKVKLERRSSKDHSVDHGGPLCR